MSSKSEILKASDPVACPECSEMFLLPDGMDAQAVLACPHCDEEITGKQLMASMLPTAAIVKTGPATETNTSVETAPEITETASPRSSGAIRHEIDEQSYTIPKPLKTAQRRSSSRYPQRTKKKPRKKKEEEKKSGGVGELLRIAFGCLLAIPIAQMILWWAFSADPAGIAPTVHQYVPLLVPAKVYEPEVVAEEEQRRSKDMPESQTMHDIHIPITIKRD